MDGRIFIGKYLLLAVRGRMRKRCAALAFTWFTNDSSFQTISRLDPKFIALHCQEVGGKNYEQSMRHVEDFVR